MSGTIPLSMTQQFNEYGTPLSGGQLYIIQVGTVSTPQNAYQDTGLTIPMPYPMTLDAAGRVPQFFVADGFVKIRLQDSSGVVQLASDSVMVIGPSSGGGGGGATVDPTQLIQTGNMIFRYDVGVISGYVRLNGLTIGSATSGSTERSNLDCQALFQHLWGVDSALVVSGGRGPTATADWTANKQIALPDLRGRVFAAMDDMGNTDAARLSVQVASTTLGGVNAANVVGSGTDKARIIRTTNLPAYTPTGSVTNGAITITHNAASNTSTASSDITPGSVLGTYTGATITASQAASVFTGAAQGGTAAAFSIVQPTMVCTFYIKL